MIFYLFLVILAIIPVFFFFVNKNSNSKKKYLIYIFGLMTILASLRKYTIGIDLEIIYYPYFELIKDIDKITQLINIGIEPGFAIFMKILSILSNNYQIFIIATSLISFPIFGYFIYKNSEDVVLSSLMFLLTANYFMELNVVRQACAISFIIIAYELLKKKKNVLFVLLILLATSFHSSSIFFLLLPIIKKINIKRGTSIVFLIIAIFTISFLPEIIECVSNVIYSFGLSSNKNYTVYLENKVHGASYINLFSISEVLISLGIFLVGLYSYNLKNISSINKKDYTTLLILTFCYFLFNFLALRINVVRRMALFFIPFAYVLFPNSLNIMKNKFNKKIIYFSFILFIGVRYIYMLFGLADSLFGVLPFEFFWQK